MAAGPRRGNHRLLVNGSPSQKYSNLRIWYRQLRTDTNRYGRQSGLTGTCERNDGPNECGDHTLSHHSCLKQSFFETAGGYSCFS